MHWELEQAGGAWEAEGWALRCSPSPAGQVGSVVGSTPQCCALQRREVKLTFLSLSFQLCLWPAWCRATEDHGWWPQAPPWEWAALEKAWRKVRACPSFSCRLHAKRGVSSPRAAPVRFASWKGRSHPSGEANEPHQLGIIKVNELPLINRGALGLVSRCVLGGGVLSIKLRSV